MAASVELLEQQLAELGPAAMVERLNQGQSGGRLDAELDALVELARNRAQSDPALAGNALDVCRTVASRLQRRDVQPHVDYIRARMDLTAGRPDSALTLIARARAGWLAINRPLDAFRTDLGRMNVLDDLGRHGEAVEVGESLLDDLGRLGPIDADGTGLVGWLRAAAHENLGAAYGYTGRYREALASYERAEVTYHQVGGSADVARCRANRGVERVAMGHALDGRNDVAAAARMFLDIDDRYSHAKCLGHMADAELLLGWYTACLEHITEARTVLAELEATTEGVRLALAACRAYQSLNLWGESIDIGNEAEDLLHELGLAHDLAEARFLLAAAHAAIDEPQRALELLERVVAGAEDSDDVPLRLRALTLRSRVLAAAGACPEAERSAREAVEVAAVGRWLHEEWGARLQLSRLTEGDEAEQHLAVASQLADELDLPHLRYPVLIEAGRRARDVGRPGEARQMFNQAIEVVEVLRSHTGDATTRAGFLEGRTAAYDELLATVLLDDTDSSRLLAFDLAEQSRARTLTDMMAGHLTAGHATVGTVSPSTEASGSAQEVVELQADLDACYAALLQGGGNLDRDRRRAVARRATELETMLQRARLEAGGETRRRASPTAERPIVARPRSDEQVVEYHIADGRLIAFVWSRGELRLVSNLPALAEARQLVDSWIRQCERYRLASTLPDAARSGLTAAANQSLRQIWLRLVAPIIEHLEPGGELLIIPSGPLHAVPFAALPAPEHRLGETWIVSLSLSYAAADLLPARHRRTERSLVVGVADEAAPAVLDEARTVASLLPESDRLLGESATLDGLRAALAQRRDVVHLACHGMHRSQNPMFSSLRLADGWLTAHDVMSLDVAGSLVVLSACETGRQERERLVAEPVGLAHSFLAVGARAVVVSLWLADDAVTAELMSEFYLHLNDGQRPAAALQRARTTTAARHPHPAAWASFSIHGGLSTKGNP